MVASARSTSLSSPSSSSGRDERRALRGLRQMAGAEVGRPPPHRPGHEPPGADDPRHPVLHELVAERDEDLGCVALREGSERRLEVDGLEGHEGVVEALRQIRGVGIDVEGHRALLSDHVEPQAGLTHARDVVGVGVERTRGAPARP